LQGVDVRRLTFKMPSHRDGLQSPLLTLWFSNSVSEPSPSVETLFRLRFSLILSLFRYLEVESF